MEYQIMKFGKSKNKISIVHLRKPLKNGLAGFVSSSYFKNNLPIVVDDLIDKENDYDFACLAFSKDKKCPRIMMTRNVFYDIKKGLPYARMILFHEIGHYVFRDSLNVSDETEEIRLSDVKKGIVSEQELVADKFAVKYLGLESVIEGLEELEEIIQSEYSECDEVSKEITLTEIKLRIKTLIKRENKNG